MDLLLIQNETEKKTQLNGEINASFAATQLEAMDREGAESRITLHDVQGAAAILHVAGTDTVSILLFADSLVS
jgi:hypothetical protein